MANENERAQSTNRPGQPARDARKQLSDVSLDAMRAATDQAHATAEQAGDAANDAFRIARQRTAEASDAVGAWFGGSTTATRAMMQAGQEISSAWLDFTRDSLQKSVDSMAAMARCRSIPELMTVQGDLMREGLRDSVSAGQRLVEITLRATGQAAQDAGRQSPPPQA